MVRKDPQVGTLRVFDGAAKTQESHAEILTRTVPPRRNTSRRERKHSRTLQVNTARGHHGNVDRWEVNSNPREAYAENRE